LGPVEYLAALLMSSESSWIWSCGFFQEVEHLNDGTAGSSTFDRAVRRVVVSFSKNFVDESWGTARLGGALSSVVL